MKRLRNRPEPFVRAEKVDPLAAKAKEREMYALAEKIIRMSTDFRQKCGFLLTGLLNDQRMTQADILQRLEQFDAQRRAVDDDELFQPSRQLDRSPVAFGNIRRT